MRCMSPCQVQDFRLKSANEARTEFRSIDKVFHARASDSDKRGNDPVALKEHRKYISFYTTRRAGVSY